MENFAYDPLGLRLANQTKKTQKGNLRTSPLKMPTVRAAQSAGMPPQGSNYTVVQSIHNRNHNAYYKVSRIQTTQVNITCQQAPQPNYKAYTYADIYCQRLERERIRALYLKNDSKGWLRNGFIDRSPNTMFDSMYNMSSAKHNSVLAKPSIPQNSTRPSLSFPGTSKTPPRSTNLMRASNLTYRSAELNLTLTSCTDESKHYQTDNRTRNIWDD